MRPVGRTLGGAVKYDHVSLAILMILLGVTQDEMREVYEEMTHVPSFQTGLWMNPSLMCGIIQSAADRVRARREEEE